MRFDFAFGGDTGGSNMIIRPNDMGAGVFENMDLNFDASSGQSPIWVVRQDAQPGQYSLIFMLQGVEFDVSFEVLPE